jgi:hypothetical protein
MAATVSKQFPAAQATAQRARGAPIDPRTKQMEIPADAFNECVYRLIPDEYTPPAKEQRYRSQFSQQARKDFVSGMKPAGTCCLCSFYGSRSSPTEPASKLSQER